MSGHRNTWDFGTGGREGYERAVEGRSFVLPFISVGPYLSGKVRQMHPRVLLSATSS